MYKYFIKPLLFLLPPEKAHYFTVGVLQQLYRFRLTRFLLTRWWRWESSALAVRKMGLSFKNPIGLAAGFDKNGKWVREMSALGFGFIEVGTVTPLAQEGNPRPRLFRLPNDRALINRMGFNNEGLESLEHQLSTLDQGDVIVGGNIGKNKDTPQERAEEDYLASFDKLFPHVDYFVVNVSSPNTPGLRKLQDREPLDRLLGSLQKRNRAQASPKPLLLKIAPDLTFAQLEEVIEVVLHHRIDGIIATNTSLDRSQLRTPSSLLEKIGPGGLSGAPVAGRATEVIRYIRERVPQHFTIIGVGGIHTAEEALAKLEAGADLIQIYTGLIYEGPKLIKDIKRALAK